MLYSTSTVCRTWYLAANWYLIGLHHHVSLDHGLFSNICVNADAIPDVLHLLIKERRCPIGAPRTIKLDPTILRSIVKQFPNVSHLELINCSWEHEAELDDIQTISHSFIGVRKLTVKAMNIYEPPENVFPILSTLFPSLECLELIDITCANLKIPPTQVPSTFSTLIIKNADDIHSLQRVLCPVIRKSQLASLFIEGDQTPDDWSLLNEVVRERVVMLRYDSTCTEDPSKFNIHIP